MSTKHIKKSSPGALLVHSSQPVMGSHTPVNATTEKECKNVFGLKSIVIKRFLKL